ncbi:MAG: winged helix-turn-helix domain-containing tetratricopeptide repeat protein [Rhodospirillales bacterium]
MIYHFGDFALDTDSLELSQGGAPVEVEPQVFSLLACLIENRERVVSKDELIELVWDGRIVSDGTLNTRINSVRRAVGDDGKRQAVIKTFPRRGFRFVAALDGDGTENPPAEITAISDKPSIAVLPFENLSGDPEQEYFSDGIAEDIITALSRLRWLSVISRNTMFTFKGQAVDVQAVAKDLDVRYILEGSVRKAASRVRISVQLVDGGSGNQLWADRYDRELEDIFEVQDEVTASVAGSVQSQLGVSEQNRVRNKPPDSLDAWEAYQRGVALLNERTDQSIIAASEYFERAMELDPNFVLAYAGYVDSVVIIADRRDPAKWDKAEYFARRAVALDTNESKAHAALAWCLLFNRDLSQALAELETALNLNPSDPAIHMAMGTGLNQSGRAAGAIPYFQMAIRLSPRDAEIGRFYARLMISHFCLGQYEEAIEWGRKAVQYPNAVWARAILTSVYAHFGAMDEAERMLAVARERHPQLSISFIRDVGAMPHPEYNALFIDGLRKAGVPEE